MNATNDDTNNEIDNNNNNIDTNMNDIDIDIDNEKKLIKLLHKQ